MGGGGPMRAAAKVAGISVVNCGLRGTAAENPVTTAARKTTRPVSSIASPSSVDEFRPYLHVTSPRCTPPRPSRAWSEIDGWEFAGAMGDEKMPRLVFGGAPALAEAKEATSELKDALEKAYLSSPASIGYGDAYMADQNYGYSDVLDTDARLTSEKSLAPPPPQHAIQAFRVLSESPAAQNVVASIACDPNVWNAVLQNPALQGFLQSQKSGATFLGVHEGAEESIADTDIFYQHSPNGSHASSVFGESESGGFTDSLQNIKLSVIDMWSNLSNYFQNLFGGPVTCNIFPDANGSARIGFEDKTLEASFMGLAVMAILVVVLKRY